jgi:hypothetical protein
VNRREKILSALTGTMASIFAIGVGVDRLVLTPAAEAAKETIVLRAELDKLLVQEGRAVEARRELTGLARRTYGTTADEAIATAGQRITTRLQKAGLEDRSFTRLPIGARPLRRGGAQEFGWSVQGVGPLERVVDLLYLLDQEPQLHRIENLRVSPTREPGQVSVNFRYLSVLIAASVPRAKGAAKPSELPDGDIDLDGPGRRRYDVIAKRDLFSPVGQKTKKGPAQPKGPDLRILKVVSLSEWNGAPEATILDLQKNSTFAVRPGEHLAGRTAVTVDYRPQPSRTKPGLISFSRLVLRDSNGYWAVEAGATLADRYSLKTDELPPGILYPGDAVPPGDVGLPTDPDGPVSPPSESNKTTPTPAVESENATAVGDG